MIQALLFGADLLLVLGLTLRMTRFVVTDDLGGWLIREPAQKWVMSGAEKTGQVWSKTWRYKLVSGLDCPFCVGFWIGALAVLSLIAVGGPGADGPLATVWRVGAGIFTLNWLAAHIGSRAGDAGYAEETDSPENDA